MAAAVVVTPFAQPPFLRTRIAARFLARYTLSPILCASLTTVLLVTHFTDLPIFSTLVAARFLT